MKRTLNYFLSLLLIGCGFQSMHAYDFAAENQDGVMIYYNITKSLLREVEVTSSGSDYLKYSDIVNIPDTVTNNGKNYNVTGIGESAFYNCYTLREVDIPSGVTYIGNRAFSGCSIITRINIPFGVATIGNYAFANCSKLPNIVMPNSVTSIGTSAFEHCEGLISANISNSVTSIQAKTFASCMSLTDIIIPSSVTSIGKHAFSGCRSFTNIDLPSSITAISDSAFAYCYIDIIKIGFSNATFGKSSFLGSIPSQIYIYSTVMPEIRKPLFDDDDPDELTYTNLYVPVGMEDQCSSDIYWKKAMNIYNFADALRNKIDAFLSGGEYTAGQDVGQYEENAVSNFNSAMLSAMQLLEVGGTNKKYYETFFSLDSVHVALLESISLTGYCRIVSAGKGSGFYSRLEEYPGILYDDEFKYSLYNTEGYVAWKTYDKNDYSQIFYMTGSGKGECFIKNISDDTYIDKRTSSYGGKVQTSENEETLHKITPVNAAKVTITDMAYSSNYVYSLTSSHNGSAGNYTEPYLSTWGTVEEAKTYGMNVWFLEPVPEKEVNALKKYYERGIALREHEKTLYVGDEIRLEIIPNEASSQVSWHSFDSSIVEVTTTGLAIGKKKGITNIIVVYGSENKSDTCTITVIKKREEAIAELQAYVDSAQTICTNAVEGLGLDEYASGAKTALQGVIDEVSATISATMDEESITQGTTKLDAALAEFESKRITSTDIDYSVVNDIIYINNVSSASGTQITLPVILNNTDNISDIQFDIILPTGVTIAKDEDDFELIDVGERTTAKKHSVDCLDRPDGSIRIMCTSSKGYTFEGNSGTVLLMTLNLGEIEDGDYTIRIKNAISSNADNTYHLPNTAATISIVNFVLGDINGDGEINVGDLSRLVNMILNDYSTPGATFNAADINGDGELNVGDYSRLVQMILNAPVSGSKGFAGVALSKNYAADLLSAEVDESTSQIALYLKNNGKAFNSMQFDVVLPEGVSIDVDAISTTARTHGMDIYNNGTRVVVSGFADKVIRDEDGAVLYLPVKASANLTAGTYEVEFANAVLGTVEGNAVYSRNFSTPITTNDLTGISSSPQSSIFNAQSIFDLNGRKVADPKNGGIYIINGKKVKAK